MTNPPHMTISHVNWKRLKKSHKRVFHVNIPISMATFCPHGGQTVIGLAYYQCCRYPSSYVYEIKMKILKADLIRILLRATNVLWHMGQQGASILENITICLNDVFPKNE